MELLEMKTNQKDLVLAHLKGGSTLNDAEAKKLFKVNNLRNVIGYLRNDGVDITTHNSGTSSAYFELAGPVKKHKKLIEVTDEIHATMKRISLETSLRGKTIMEKELYLQAIEIGIKQLEKKHL